MKLKNLLGSKTEEKGRMLSVGAKLLQKDFKQE